MSSAPAIDPPGRAPAFPALDEDLVRRYDVAGPRYTSYPTAPEWTEDFGPDDRVRALARAAGAGAEAPLSFYVHLPFCRSLCAFCGCNVVIARDPARADPYLDDVAREMALVAPHLGERRALSQVHWGGGTPTFLVEAQLQRLHAEITRHFRVLPGAEVACEVNPAVTRPSQVETLRALGFNRLSMGVQDLDPKVQRTIRRVQPYETTRGLVEHARSLGFEGINLDLIYGLPHQTARTWADTVSRVVDLGPDRLAIYSFAFVPSVRHHQRTLPEEALPRGIGKLDLLRIAHDVLTANGYRPIGMDHFARDTDALALAAGDGRLGRNFQGYTVAAADDVVAFGVTGISDLGGAYAQNVRPLKAYSQALAAGRMPVERGVWLTAEDRERRRVISDLMCRFEVDLGDDAPARFAREVAELRDPRLAGLASFDGRRVNVTPLGRLFVRNVALVFDTRLRRRLAEGARPTFSRTV